MVLAPLVIKRSLTSSLLSSERARRPCRTRGGGCVSLVLVYTLSMVMLTNSTNYLSMGTYVKVIIPWDDWYCNPGACLDPPVNSPVLKSFVMKMVLGSLCK